MRYFLAFPFFVIGGVIILIGVFIGGQKEANYMNKTLEKIDKWIEKKSRED